MLDILRDHLSQSTSPELLNAVEAAHELFERIELEDYEQSFEEILLIEGSALANHQDAVQSIVTLTQQLLHQILQQHGVVPHEHLTLREASLLVRGILDLPDYEDRDTLRRTLALEGPPLETFCELLSLVTPMAVQQLMTLLDEVDDALLLRLQQMLAQEPETEDLESESETPDSLHQLRLYMSLFSQERGEQLLGAKMITSLLPTGLDFHTYADLYGREFENLEAATAAEELLSIALICKTAGAPQQTVESHVEQYISNLDKITQIRIKVGELLIQLNERHAKT